MPDPNKEIPYPEEVVSVVGKAAPKGQYLYLATRRDKTISRMVITARQHYKWFHQWRTSTATGETQIIHYFSTKKRAAPVPAWVPGRAVALEPVEIAYPISFPDFPPPPRFPPPPPPS